MIWKTSNNKKRGLKPLFFVVRVEVDTGLPSSGLASRL